MNFDSYKTSSKQQEHVKAVCQDFVQSEGTSCNTGLIMIGRNGTGKTMLSCIIMQELIRIDPKNRWGYRYIEAIKIIRQIKDTWRLKVSEQTTIDKFVNPKLLVIDELGVQYGSETEKQFLTEIINDRYNIQAPTILVGNITSKDAKELLGDRIIDRFWEGGKSLVFDWDSYRKGKCP